MLPLPAADTTLLSALLPSPLPSSFPPPQVAGTSGKVKVDGDSDDEGVACETYGTAILEALGHERRDEVLARLYLVRTDVQYAVRNGALHVWKTLVVNTPKTLQEILPALMTEVIAALADEGGGGGEVVALRAGAGGLWQDVGEWASGADWEA